MSNIYVYARAITATNNMVESATVGETLTLVESVFSWLSSADRQDQTKQALLGDLRETLRKLDCRPADGEEEAVISIPNTTVSIEVSGGGITVSSQCGESIFIPGRDIETLKRQLAEEFMAHPEDWRRSDLNLARTVAAEMDFLSYIGTESRSYEKQVDWRDEAAASAASIYGAVTDVSYKICQHLDVPSRFAFGRVNKRFSSIAANSNEQARLTFVASQMTRWRNIGEKVIEGILSLPEEFQDQPLEALLASLTKMSRNEFATACITLKGVFPRLSKPLQARVLSSRVARGISALDLYDEIRKLPLKDQHRPLAALAKSLHHRPENEPRPSIDRLQADVDKADISSEGELFAVLAASLRQLPEQEILVRFDNLCRAANSLSSFSQGALFSALTRSLLWLPGNERQSRFPLLVSGGTRIDPMDQGNWLEEVVAVAPKLELRANSLRNVFHTVLMLHHALCDVDRSRVLISLAGMIKKLELADRKDAVIATVAVVGSLPHTDQREIVRMVERLIYQLSSDDCLEIFKESLLHSGLDIEAHSSMLESLISSVSQIPLADQEMAYHKYDTAVRRVSDHAPWKEDLLALLDTQRVKLAMRQFGM